MRVSRDVGSANRSVDSFAWSPDSLQLAFAANFDAVVGIGGSQNFLAKEIYVVNRDGTGERRISGNIGSPATVELRNPQWSPNGRYVLQEVYEFDGTLGPMGGPAFALNLHDTTVGGRDSRRLVTAGIVRNAHWSPTSARIVYMADRSSPGEYRLYVMNNDGANNIQLTQGGTFNSDAAWSPDGMRIAFVDAVAPGAFPTELIVREGIAGETPVLLARLPANNRQTEDFAWSPDSARVAYVSEEATAGVREAYVTLQTGSGGATKVSGPLVAGGDVLEIAWSPDGQRIAYAADQLTDTIVNLFVSTVTGSNTHISAGLGNEEIDRFAWSRDGAVLGYTFGAASTGNIVPSGLRVSNANGTSPRIVSGTLLTGIFSFEFAP